MRLRLGGKEVLETVKVGCRTHHFHSQESRRGHSLNEGVEVKLKRDALSKLCRRDGCPGG